MDESRKIFVCRNCGHAVWDAPESVCSTCGTRGMFVDWVSTREDETKDTSFKCVSCKYDIRVTMGILQTVITLCCPKCFDVSRYSLTLG